MAPCVTISREVGAGGLTVGGLVCERLRALEAQPAPRWTLFDKNLVARILDDHQLPSEIGEFIAEEATPAATSFLEEVLGLRPSAWALFEATRKTVRRLAQMGHCVIVGRGGNFITWDQPLALQVRLVASVDARVQRVMDQRGWSEDEARAHVRKSDKGRKRYIQEHFSRDINDALAYDLVLNTERMSPDEAAQVIVAALQALRER
jgi:hypothetical protein